MKEHLYTVVLHGVEDGIASEPLEQAFRADMNDQFGGEGPAAEALHAHLDGLDERGLTWAQAEMLAIARLPAPLPMGAHFECDLNWDALRRPDA